MTNPDDLIGVVFKTRGKAPRTCKVVDVLRTYNSKNELVKVRFVATHDFCGQSITDSDICKATIDMGRI